MPESPDDSPSAHSQDKFFRVPSGPNLAPLAAKPQLVGSTSAPGVLRSEFAPLPSPPRAAKRPWLNVKTLLLSILIAWPVALFLVAPVAAGLGVALLTEFQIFVAVVAGYALLAGLFALYDRVHRAWIDRCVLKTRLSCAAALQVEPHS